jgi:type IV secretion system protein TrbI
LEHAVQGRDPLTLLSIGSETGANNNEGARIQALRRDSSQGFSQVGEQVVGRSLNVQPTITIRPGFPVRIIVTGTWCLSPTRAEDANHGKT